MVTIFLVCHLLLLCHSPKYSWNKLAKYEKLEKYTITRYTNFKSVLSDSARHTCKLMFTRPFSQYCLNINEVMYVKVQLIFNFKNTPIFILFCSLAFPIPMQRLIYFRTQSNIYDLPFLWKEKTVNYFRKEALS